MLKIIALISMIIDHIGAFFGLSIIFRIIGRLALPIYCYGIAKGIKNTSNIKKYMSRMFIFAILSQIIWSFIGFEYINILFTFFISILFYHFVKERQYIINIILIILVILLREKLEYELYPFFLVALFYFVKDKKYIVLLMLVLNLVSINIFNISVNCQHFSILSLFFIFKYEDIKTNIKPILFYWAYPVHLFILMIIENII